MKVCVLNLSEQYYPRRGYEYNREYNEESIDCFSYVYNEYLEKTPNKGILTILNFALPESIGAEIYQDFNLEANNFIVRFCITNVINSYCFLQLVSVKNKKTDNFIDIDVKNVKKIVDALEQIVRDNRMKI